MSDEVSDHNLSNCSPLRPQDYGNQNDKESTERKRNALQSSFLRMTTFTFPKRKQISGVNDGGYIS